MDWELRELEEASHERLLTEIGVLKDSLQQVHATSRVGELESELILKRQQVLQANHDLLAARDFAIGAAAQAREQQAQLLAGNAQSSSRVGELESEFVFGNQQVLQAKHDLLAARDFAIGALAKAGEQEAKLIALGSQLAAAQERIAFLSKHINRIRNSTTWKLGRITMLPARIAKRILSRSS